MSDPAEALTFGPQWIRDLSNGTKVCAPPPSPGPKHKLADFRYGKEEMLALFTGDLTTPDLGEVAEYILTNEISQPLAYIPMTEEEQRNSFGSLNSAAVLKMMGRGGQRGGRGGSTRGGRGSGRGRGEGGFHRGFSAEETASRGEETWPREAVTKKLSWSENGRPGYNEKGAPREQETPPRAFELSAPPVRHKEASRALSSGNWRTSESGEGDDDGGGWIVSGSRGSEKWRGSPRGGWHSQGSREDHSRGEHGGGERRRSDSWSRSHDKNSFDDLPEWSKSDNVFEPDLGSFDSSGAFCVTKEKKELDDTEQKEPLHVEESKEDWDKELNEDSHGVSESENKNVDLHDHEWDTSEEKDVGRKKGRKLEEDNTDVKPPINLKKDKPAGHHEEDISKMATDGEEKTSHVKSKQSPGKGDSARISPPVITPRDEIGADLERVAESCIANLDVGGEEHVEREVRPNSAGTPGSADMVKKSAREDQTKWWYRDPQGQEQGPFTNEEMVEWFHHGYFTMQLSIRRNCDAVYLPLGEVIKRWGRVPFLPGPAPAPITHQQLMSQQTMFMQQQLLQQHYQQLQKQAILQQIQQEQQQQKDQQRHHTDLHLNTNNSTVDPPGHPRVLSPHSLPVTNHPVAHGGAAETIWGPEPESPKGTWSPATSNTSEWDKTSRHKSPVPSVEEARKLEEEKVEGEKREVELISLKRKEEEKKQMMKRQEEERLEREALQRENELKVQKKKEEEEEKARREKERRRQEAQRQAEAEKRKEAAKQKKETQQEQKQKKESEEQRQHKQSEIREQQRQHKQSEIREQQRQVQEQQREEQKRKEQQRQEQQRKEQERKEKEKQERQQEERKRKQQRLEEQNAQVLQQQLQQNRIQSNNSSRWGSQNAAALSLSEIQEQEEKNRRAHDEKMRELEARQRQLESVAAQSHGWADKQPVSQPTVKSLKTIQDEQARQLPSRQNKQAPRPQVSPVSSSGAWANTWTAGNNNVWAGAGVDEDDDDGAPEEETGFWDEAVRATSKSVKCTQPQPQKTHSNQARVSSTHPAVSNGKKGKKANKEEESVRKLFQQPAASSDPFTEWCTIALAGISTSVDIPTFIAFLRDIESPYEIHDYVRDFLGDSKQAQSFAKEFIEKNRTRSPAPAKEYSPAPNPVVKPTSTFDGIVARGCGGGNRTFPMNETDNKDTAGGNGKNKKKKKQRMQKIDPSILGFSVNAAAERVNMGEIQSVDDS